MPVRLPRRPARYPPLFYGPSAYGLSAASRSRLDAFLQKGRDCLTIRSYTEGPDGDEDNLSKRRADGVYRYFMQRNTPAGNITVQYFGEATTLADNSTEEGHCEKR